ncbi:hypothetical protein EHM76_01310 [bacterium]|nr:MAG: hypothetical protein EHM76_01310 [bacterium]
MTTTPEMLTPESPERLRECLTALAEAAGKDVHRFEISVTEQKTIRLLVTSSRAESEGSLAQEVGRRLEEMFAKAAAAIELTGEP